jgi:hypothetical protein
MNALAALELAAPLIALASIGSLVKAGFDELGESAKIFRKTRDEANLLRDELSSTDWAIAGSR